ncbi:tandem-95 repeat protein [Chloroflexi bacterium TSY]|nr:tandem-95 repeat protein [Chloroflexi bacterium TSY]
MVMQAKTYLKRSLPLALLLVLGLILVTPAVTQAGPNDPPAFLLKWGTTGSGDGQFNNPIGVAVDSVGNVYVADGNNHRIQKFNSSGGFLTKWGTQGTGDGQFDFPRNVAVDSADNVYVVDQNNDRIQKFDSSGGFLTKWGSSGSGNSQFGLSTGVAVDGADNVYVVEWHRVQKFNSNGGFLTTWGSEGFGDGQFFVPEAIAADSAGNVYVVDGFLSNRIQKFGSSGGFLTTWGSSGSGDGQFNSPTGAAVDSAGNVYVADLGNSRIQKFGSSGGFLTKWGSSGSGDGQFSDPIDVAVDSAGNVYVVDRNNSRIQKFAPANTAPVAMDDSYTINEDTPLNVAAPGVLSNDRDADSDPLTAVKDSDPSNGTLTLNSDGSFDYTPNANFCGQDSFTYHANDGTDDSNVATVTIDVVCVNDAPVAVDDAYTTNEDTVLNVPAPGVLGNDSDPVEGDPLTAVLDNGPSNGTLTLNADGSFTYTPNAGFFGTDSFAYKANDGSDDSNVATVTITVNEVVANCGGFAVIKTGPGQFSAPSFSGTLILGTPHYDWIIGTHGPDLILGRGGPDDIYGDQHDDWLGGGPGDDTLYGGNGWDDLEGNRGQDTLYGENGYDVLLGGGQSDWLFGGNGNDFCKGGPGSDTITDCEGASSAAVGEVNADDVAMETADIDAARTRNDGENGEHAIVQRIKDLFLPLITR